MHGERHGQRGMPRALQTFEMPSTKARPQPDSLHIPFTLGLCLFLAIAIFFLWQEHRAHLFGALPYALLLLCPFIHLFMHRAHTDHKTTAGDHGNHGHRLQEGRRP